MVYISILTYDGKIHHMTALSVIGCVAELWKNGVSTYVDFVSGQCYLHHARNIAVDRFLRDKSADRLLFVDADVAFQPEAVLRFVKHDKDVVAGVYPVKYGDEWPVRIYTNEDGTPRVEDGLIRAALVPTGFMMINRRAFDVIAEKIGKRKYVSKDGEFTEFFDVGRRVAGDDRMWGEDFLFCRDCELAGVGVYVDPDVTFAHYGEFYKKGNYHEYLVSLRGKQDADLAG